MLALDIDDEHRRRKLVHRADAIEILDQAGGFAPQHRLLLLDVLVDGTVGLHLFDLPQPGQRAFDRVEVGQRAPQPAPGDVKLLASFGRFTDGFLRLLFGADKEHPAAFAAGGGEEIARQLQLFDRFAQVDDVDPVARIEDELLHLGVPPFGLVPEVDTPFQQFLHANTDHIFLWLRVPRIFRRTIPRNTGLYSVLLWPPALTRARALSGRLSLSGGPPSTGCPSKRVGKLAKPAPRAIFIFNPSTPRPWQDTLSRCAVCDRRLWGLPGPRLQTPEITAGATTRPQTFFSR